MSTPAINYMAAESVAQVEGLNDCLTGTPWENLGARVPKGASVQEMLVAAGLDWNVLRGDSKIHVQTDDGIVVLNNPKSFALVRDTDMSILSPFVGPRYKIIQNSDAFGVFCEFVDAGQMTMETAGSLNNGQHIWGLARTGHRFELADGEVIESYFLLLQSHLYGYALKAMWTPIRFPGGHTLVQGINKKGVGGNIKTTYTMSHARKFTPERIQEIKEVVGIAAKAMVEFQGHAEFMAKMRVSEADAIEYLASIFDRSLKTKRTMDQKPMPRTLTEVIEAQDVGRNLKKVARQLQDTRDKWSAGTAWGYYSAAQHMFDHEMGHKRDTALESAWIGKNRDEKQRAFKLATILATSKGKE